MPLQATSGAASYDAFGGGVPVAPNYIEDVFSTWLYTGNGSTQTITNGIDLAGEGGLVWTKSRTNAAGHRLSDTARGIYQTIFTNTTDAQVTSTTYLTAFNANGFTLGNTNNSSGQNYASWTFRKQPKFFDVVTYTGNGANRTIAHSLGSVPGCIMVKRTDTTGNWRVYHRGVTNFASPDSEDNAINLNSNGGVSLGTTDWNGTAPTSAVFSLGTDATVNASGGTYVAYIYAHNAGGFGLSGTDNVISCGSYEGNGGSQEISLGYEPQWIMVKRLGIGEWFMFDTMRGWSLGPDLFLAANTSSSEVNFQDNFGSTFGEPTATGFRLTSGYIETNASSNTYIYITIRRGPMKVPTTGTSVFDADATTGGGSGGKLISTGFPVDLCLSAARFATDNKYVIDRLRGGTQYLFSDTTGAEGANGTPLDQFDTNVGVIDRLWNTSTSAIYWNFRRAPGFFDEVCYTGTGSATTVAHNLAAVPQLMIVKRRNGIANWRVYSQGISTTNFLTLNSDIGASIDTSVWNSTAPTASVFTLGSSLSVNASGGTYVNYLFASCPGVSKVGSYTGNGSSQTINCGFAAGARFVLVKRTNNAGAWYVWDTARGIVAGNDPYLLLNSTAAEVTTDDSIDPVASGFAVNQVAATNINVSGASYIYLAIA